MPTEQFITFKAGGFKLAGTLHMPDAPSPPVVIGCHGLLADRRSQKQISLARTCTREGLAYFRFDHRGCGDSEGDFAKVTSLAARRQDLYHAVETLQHHSRLGPIAALFGSSFGGTVVLAYAARHPAPALITYAAPLNSNDIHHDNIRDNNGQLPSAALLTDGLTFDIAPDLPAVSNILIAHSRNDETVPVRHAERIYQLVRDPKRLVVFDGGDHRMSDTDHQQRFDAIFLEWILTYATLEK